MVNRFCRCGHPKVVRFGLTKGVRHKKKKAKIVDYPTCHVHNKRRSPTTVFCEYSQHLIRGIHCQVHTLRVLPGSTNMSIISRTSPPLFLFAVAQPEENQPEENQTEVFDKFTVD